MWEKWEEARPIDPITARTGKAGDPACFCSAFIGVAPAQRCASAISWAGAERLFLSRAASKNLKISPKSTSPECFVHKSVKLSVKSYFSECDCLCLILWTLEEDMFYPQCSSTHIIHVSVQWKLLFKPKLSSSSYGFFSFRQHYIVYYKTVRLSLLLPFLLHF